MLQILAQLDRLLPPRAPLLICYSHDVLSRSRGVSDSGIWRSAVILLHARSMVLDGFDLASFQHLAASIAAVAVSFAYELPSHPLGLRSVVRTFLHKCHTATVGQRSQHSGVFSLGRSAAS